MYLPGYFRESRPEVLHALIRARPLAALITRIGDALDANHVPVEVSTEPAPFGTLRGHIARANPLWKTYHRGDEALALFQGPQAYVSPSFYPSKRATGEVVPTWNYAVVHAHGTLSFTEDADWLRDLVTRLTAAHEKSRPLPWQLTDAPAAYVQRMLEQIVGFEFAVTQLTGKWKINQNHPLANRQGVVAGLRERSDADSRELAELLHAFNAGDAAPGGEPAS